MWRCHRAPPRARRSSLAQPEGEKGCDCPRDDDRERRRARELERRGDERGGGRDDQVGAMSRARRHDRDEHGGDREVDAETFGMRWACRRSASTTWPRAKATTTCGPPLYSLCG